MSVDNVQIEPDGTMRGADAATAGAARRSGLTPSKATVVIVGAALAWLAFARGSFSRLG